MQRVSTVTRARTRLAKVVDGLAQLIRNAPVQRRDRDGGGVFFIAPEYYWGDLSAAQRAVQLALKREYQPIAELLQLLLTQAPEDLVTQLNKADKRFRVWLECHTNWSLSPNPSANVASLRTDAAELEKILGVLELTGDGEIVVVPDTNSLLASPDPTSYRAAAGSDAFIFILLPTVLGELDHLKVEHRNIDVRHKAQAAITRVKGWRQQGSLSSGVTVDKSITVRACSSEPDMKKTLSWLDADVKDDRIIASVIALQAEQPSARILLVTGDVNLQNKADAALIESAEPP